VTLGFQPNMDLFTEIEKMGIEVYAAGDCRSPGRIADATKAGYQAAVRI
jgi:2,4-dienoyl-CoA reductase (NADPH2)